jgi:hypothetical protein
VSLVVEVKTAPSKSFKRATEFSEFSEYVFFSWKQAKTLEVIFFK